MAQNRTAVHLKASARSDRAGSRFWRPAFFRNRPTPGFVLLWAVTRALVGALLVLVFWWRPEDTGSPDSFRKALPALTSLYFAVVAYLYRASLADLNRRWAEAASLHQELLLKCQGEPPSPGRAALKKYLEVGLALELIESELWAHRSFANFFEAVLTEAIRRIPTDRERNELLEKLKSGQISQSRAGKLLARYRRELHQTLKAEPPTPSISRSSRLKKAA